MILSVLQLLSQFSDLQLVEITHNQDPWLNAIRNGNNTEITKIDIEKYFNPKKFNKKHTLEI